MENVAIAHDLSKANVLRSKDVLVDTSVNFSSMMLKEPIRLGLHNAGFQRPSPIQLRAIPVGRMGTDMVVQAKSGTGKTCVFVVIALEALQLSSIATQVLVIAPTREVAHQIQSCFVAVGSAMTDLKVGCFIGGLQLSVDIAQAKRCHVAVGTPGRLSQLVKDGHLQLDAVRLLVLDEADQLMHDSFAENINWLFWQLPQKKQIVVCSATYSAGMAELLLRYMREATVVRLGQSDQQLIGICQYYKSCPVGVGANSPLAEKLRVLHALLASLEFSQALVFCNGQSRAESVSQQLQALGHAALLIAGHLDQKTRLGVMAAMKDFEFRVLVSTDLTARGVDLDRVNVVLNFDVPLSAETYLHRIGRAGRFGSQAIAVTLATDGDEDTLFRRMVRSRKFRVKLLPDDFPSTVISRPEYWEECVAPELSNPAAATGGLPRRYTSIEMRDIGQSAEVNCCGAMAATRWPEIAKLPCQCVRAGADAEPSSVRCGADRKRQMSVADVRSTESELNIPCGKRRPVWWSYSAAQLREIAGSMSDDREFLLQLRGVRSLLRPNTVSAIFPRVRELHTRPDGHPPNFQSSVLAKAQPDAVGCIGTKQPSPPENVRIAQKQPIDYLRDIFAECSLDSTTAAGETVVDTRSRHVDRQLALLNECAAEEQKTRGAAAASRNAAGRQRRKADSSAWNKMQINDEWRFAESDSSSCESLLAGICYEDMRGNLVAMCRRFESAMPSWPNFGGLAEQLPVPSIADGARLAEVGPSAVAAQHRYSREQLLLIRGCLPAVSFAQVSAEQNSSKSEAIEATFSKTYPKKDKRGKQNKERGGSKQHALPAYSEDSYTAELAAFVKLRQQLQGKGDDRKEPEAAAEDAQQVEERRAWPLGVFDRPVCWRPSFSACCRADRAILDNFWSQVGRQRLAKLYPVAPSRSVACQTTASRGSSSVATQSDTVGGQCDATQTEASRCDGVATQTCADLSLPEHVQLNVRPPRGRGQSGRVAASLFADDAESVSSPGWLGGALMPPGGAGSQFERLFSNYQQQLQHSFAASRKHAKR